VHSLSALCIAFSGFSHGTKAGIGQSKERVGQAREGEATVRTLVLVTEKEIKMASPSASDRSICVQGKGQNLENGNSSLKLPLVTC
jgi:hypothetical protein